MHLAEFLSGPNKRRDTRGREVTHKKRGAYDEGVSTLTPSLSLSLPRSPLFCILVSLLSFDFSSLCHTSTQSLLGPSSVQWPLCPPTAANCFVAPVNRQKLLSIPRMYSILLPSRAPSLGRPPFPSATAPHFPPVRTGTLLRIRYINREDDNQTETDSALLSSCCLSSLCVSPSLLPSFFHSRFRPFRAVPAAPRDRYDLFLLTRHQRYFGRSIVARFGPAYPTVWSCFRVQRRRRRRRRRRG